MNHITTTDLRTKSSELVNSLKNGKSVSIIHRSKIIGVIKPAKEEPKALTRSDINTIKEMANKLNLPKMSYEEREDSYRKHIIDTYGKDLS